MNNPKKGHEKLQAHLNDLNCTTLFTNSKKTLNSLLGQQK